MTKSFDRQLRERSTFQVLVIGLFMISVLIVPDFVPAEQPSRIEGGGLFISTHGTDSAIGPIFGDASLTLPYGLDLTLSYARASFEGEAIGVSTHWVSGLLGDNGASSEEQIQVHLSGPGEYIVVLTVSAPDGISEEQGALTQRIVLNVSNVRASNVKAFISSPVAGKAPPLDLDGDFQVTPKDLVRFWETYDSKTGDNSYMACADWDGDLAVTLQDLARYFDGFAAWNGKRVGPDYGNSNVFPIWNHVRTNDGRFFPSPIPLYQAETVPPGFEQWVEWRVNGVPAGLGKTLSLRDESPGERTITASVFDASSDVRYMVMYKVSIYNAETSAALKDDAQFADGRISRLRAVTNPEGYEDLVNWQVSSLFGTAQPGHGRGTTFSVQFDHTFGPGGIQCLWIQADNAMLTVEGTGSPPVCTAGGPYAATACSPITFDGSGSSDPDGGPLVYSWAFGDGETGSGVSPQHSFLAPGVYQVSLAVRDDEGVLNSCHTSATITSQTSMKGACVFTDGSYQTLTASECSARSGTFFGVGSVPDSIPCFIQEPCIWVVVPILVNVLKDVAFTKDDAAAMVAAANKVLKKAGLKIRLEFDKDKHFKDNFKDGGNEDDKVDANEELGLRIGGLRELNKTFGKGKGVKVVIGDLLRGQADIFGFTTHNQSVTFVKRGEGADERSPDSMGQALAHEFCHAMTLGPRHIISITAEGETLRADATSHNPDDMGSLVWKDAKSPDDENTLTEKQREEVKKHATSRGEAKKPDDNRSPKENNSVLSGIVRFNQGGGSWTDSLGDATQPYVDLIYGDCYGYAPFVNMIWTIHLAGLFPSLIDSVTFEIPVDVAPGGLAWGPFSGIERVIIVRASSGFPLRDGHTSLNVELRDLISGTNICLPVANYRSNESIEDKTVPTTTVSEHEIVVTVPWGQVGLVGNSLAYGVLSYKRTGGTAVMADAVGISTFTLSGAGPLLTTSPFSGSSGDNLQLVGAGFKPNAPVKLLFGDVVLGVVTTNPSGGFSVTKIVPSLADPYYFVTARDSSGAFDFSIFEQLAH